METMVEVCAVCSLRLVSAIVNLGQEELSDFPAYKGTLAICLLKYLKI